jgi:nucleoside-diphosphate kinase
MLTEQTLVLLKPDTIQRNLIGKIITRFEDLGLKIIALKMTYPSEEILKKHYHIDETWARQVYEKTLESHKRENRPFNFKEPMELASSLQLKNIHLLMECPVIAIVLEAPNAIEITRKIIGSTEPKQAQPGTIRGDFASLESYALSSSKNRAVRNLVHASDTEENAKREISLWFKPEEIHSYTKELDKHF